MTIRIERTYEVEYIKRCLTHPKIWNHCTDDNSVEKDKYTPSVIDEMYWLKVLNDNVPVGVFLLHPHNSICFEVHTCLLPEIWGQSVECTLAGIDWMWENTICRRIITNVLEDNLLAIRLSLRSGLLRFGVNPKSFLKNGILHNQIMFGISKEEKCQQ